jgi:hypothetical protein
MSLPDQSKMKEESITYSAWLETLGIFHSSSREHRYMDLDDLKGQKRVE